MKRMVIFWQSATILLSAFFALCSIEVLANGFIGYKGIKLDVAGTQTWYKAHNVSWSYNGCGNYQFNSAADFPTSSLGSITGSQVLRITGYAVVGWTDNADYVAGRLQYKVWRNSATEPLSWSSLDVGNYASPVSGVANVVCSNGTDRVVGRDDFSVNLNPGLPGTYNLKIQALGRMQYRGDTTVPGNVGGSFNVNDGSEITATFTIVADANDFFRSKGSGSWNSTANWEASGDNSNWADATMVPGASAGGRVSILNGHSLTLDRDISLSSLTINSGGTFLGSDGTSRTLTLITGATFTSNGTFNHSSGKVIFAGSGTVSGTCGFFDVDLSGGVDFGSSSTINGTLALKSGGFLHTNSVTYASGSTLKYDNGGAYGNDQNSREWSSASGAGYPHHVQVSSNSILNLNTTSTPATNRSCAGNLTIDVGSTLNRNNNGTITIGGNCNVEGTLNLSSTIGGDLYVGGNAAFNGTFAANDRAVFFNGSGTQTVSKSAGNMNFDYLFVQNTSNPGVVLASNAVVDDRVELSSNARLRVDAGVSLTTKDLTNGGSLTLKASSASSYAQLLTTGAVAGSGTVTQERAITGSTNGWRFVSAPVTGGTLGNFGSSILINNGPPNNIITLNTANPNAWVGFHGLGGSTSTAIAAGKGYALYYGGSNGVNGSTVASTLSLTGSLSTSNVSVTGLSAGSAASIYGWSLVGNPFTCGLNLSGLTRSNVNEAYYIWDVDKSGGAGFASYVGTTSTPSGALNGVIPPMQGFLVKATGISPSLTIPTSARTVATPNAQLRGTSSFTHRMYVRISEPQSGKWDETAVLSDPQASVMFDGSFDAYKLNSWDAQALNLATVSADNQRLSINTTGDWDAALQVPLQLTTTLNGPMQLTTNLSEVAAGQAVWLEDLHTGAYHDLRAGSYAFTHLSNVADRFRIHFRALSTSISPDPLAGVQLYAHDGGVFVRGWDGPFALEVYDLQGRRVIADAFEAGMGSDGWFSGVSPGIYLVRCTTSEGAKSVKLRL